MLSFRAGGIGGTKCTNKAFARRGCIDDQLTKRAYAAATLLRSWKCVRDKNTPACACTCVCAVRVLCEARADNYITLEEGEEGEDTADICVRLIIERLYGVARIAGVGRYRHTLAHAHTP